VSKGSRARAAHGYDVDALKGLWPVALCLASACGRIGFDPHGGDDPGGGNGDGGNGDGGNSAGDGAITIDDGGNKTIPCANQNLGSALGASVAAGSTSGQGNDYAGCSGDGNDVTFGWFAPATASYRIDLCASDPQLDSVLYVRNGSCTGTQLACNDDACGGAAGILSRVTVSLTEGQGIVIVVDELFPTGGGNYQLAITQM